MKINLHQSIPDYDPYSESSLSYPALFEQTFKEGVPLHDWHMYLRTVFLNEYIDVNTANQPKVNDCTKHVGLRQKEVVI